ncbi:MAG: winged helix-turn-helix transcriptional regulator, partial [Treponema sp.]|nr:winged helix-turn-helix transcriptional regulator [Treponema sp.]
MNNEALDTEFIILENIYDNSGRNTSLHQRELARIAGASLGMTNSILKRLAQKGWITIRKVNSRRIQYAVSPEGINE